MMKTCWLRGLAPDAKVAFVDLADSHSGGIYTPQDLSVHYYPYAYAVRAPLESKDVGSPYTHDNQVSTSCMYEHAQLLVT